MLPLPAFASGSNCQPIYQMDTVDMRSVAQLCLTILDSEGCEVNVLEKIENVPCPEAPVDVGVGTDLPEGWCAVYRARQMQNTQIVFSYLMTVVDASRGIFSVTTPPEAIPDPGILLAEIAIYDDDDRLRYVDRRQLQVRPTLEASNARPIMPADVRMALFDYCPGQNILLDALEFTEEQITYMIRRPLDLWNEMSPDVFQATPASFTYRENWLRCVVGYLLVAASRLMRRNTLNYTASGLAVQGNKEWPAYQEEGERLVAGFKEWAQNKKIEINVGRGYSVVTSDYHRW